MERRSANGASLDFVASNSTTSPVPYGNPCLVLRQPWRILHAPDQPFTIKLSELATTSGQPLNEIITAVEGLLAKGVIAGSIARTVHRQADGTLAAEANLRLESRPTLDVVAEFMSPPDGS